MNRNLLRLGIVTLMAFFFQSTVALACAMDLIPSTAIVKIERDCPKAGMQTTQAVIQVAE